MASVNVRKHVTDDEADCSKLASVAEPSQPITLARLRRSNSEFAQRVATRFTESQFRAGSVSQAARVVCLQHSALFRGLSAAECGEIAANAREIQFERRQSIFCEGDPVESVSVLVSGRVKITQLSRSGAEVILRVKGSGEVLGGLGVQPGGYHFLSAHALETCSVLLWKARRFELLEERFSALRRNTVRIFADRLRLLEERFLELATEQVGSRLARMIVRLLEHAPHCDKGGQRIDLSREELAQMTGTTLFTVSRLLSNWEEMGILKSQRKTVIVQNRQRLIELAERYGDTGI